MVVRTNLNRVTGFGKYFILNSPTMLTETEIDYSDPSPTLLTSSLKSINSIKTPSLIVLLDTGDIYVDPEEVER
jgi:hypothetical protein